MKYRDEAARRRHRHERIAAVLLVIVLGAALAAFITWNKADDEKFKRERTYIPPPAKITPEIELLRDYLRIDTSNPPGREAAGAAWIVALLARNGVKAEVVEAAPGRPTVYARLAGRRTGEGLLLLQHIDVIPPGEGWSHPPFGAEIALSELYGRGAVDMKGIGLTHLLAFIDVARSGRMPERDLVLLAVSDEERGGGVGMKWIVENRPDLLDGVRYAIGEGGIIEVTADKVTYFGIEIGNKQYVELRVTASSIDALRAARFALAKWNVRRQPDRVLPEVRRFFADLAPTRTAFKDDLADIDRSIAEGTYWRLPIPYRQLTQNVVWIHTDRVEGKGAAANVSMLLLPRERPEKWIDWLKKELSSHEVAVADVVSAEPETPISPIGTPLYRLIKREAEQQYRVRAGTMILHRQSNDSRFLRRRGIAAYGVLPFTVTSFQSEAIHGRDERVRLDWFMEGVGLMRRIVRRWAFDGDI